MNIKKYAILGNPVKHSLSPKIHNLFAKQFDINLSYEKIEVRTGENCFAVIQNLIKNKYSGVNLTSPFKEEIFLKIQNVTDRANHAKAINTLVFEENSNIIGDNTDGIGFIRDINQNNNIELNNKNILILGAGGAARGILRPILSLKPNKIFINNRTYEKALELEKYFKTWGKVNAINNKDLKNKYFDLIINTTSCGHNNLLPDNIEYLSAKDSVCYDLSYGKASEIFLTWAKKNNAYKTISGIGMLVEQAAESFFRWHGKKPDSLLIFESLN